MQRVQVSPDPDKHVIAHVFKIAIDPYVGKLGLLRMHQGTLRQGSQVYVGDARKTGPGRPPLADHGKRHHRNPRGPFRVICAPWPRSKSCAWMPCCTIRTTKINITCRL